MIDNLKFVIIDTNKLYINVNDFDDVVDYSKDLSANEGYAHLWAKTFSLQKWYLLMIPMQEIKEEDISPLITKVNGKKNYLMFTDAVHVKEFALSHNLIITDEKIICLEVDPLNDIDWIVKVSDYLNTFNILFNYGHYGWSVKLKDLYELKEMFKQS